MRATLFFLCLALPLTGQVVISEVVTWNTGAGLDVDGNDSDWLELHNTGKSSVDMTGWYLTDDPQERPRRWQLPAGTLGAHGFRVVFCSGKDRADRRKELHTSFRLAKGGGEVALMDAEGRSVSRVSYGEAEPGVSFGFSQLWITSPVVPTGSEVIYFVPPGPIVGPEWRTPAYAGNPLWKKARAPLRFEAGSGPSRDVGTDVSADLRARGTTVYMRTGFEVEAPTSVDLLQVDVTTGGGFVAWINSVEIGRHRAPDGLLWSSTAPALGGRSPEITNHELIIPDPSRVLRTGTNVLAIQGLRVSRAEKDFFLDGAVHAVAGLTTDTDNPCLLAPPTPGSLNGIGCEERAPRPRLSLERVLFSEPLVIRVQPAPGTRYTLDGTDPTEESPAVEGPITVDGTCVLKVRRFVPGMVPSAVATGCYVKLGGDLGAFSSNLPFMVVNTFGQPIDETGHNVGHLAVFDVDGARSAFSSRQAFEGLCAIKTRGSSTLDRPKKAYRLELRNRDGEDRDVSLLGLPSDSDWILYGPHNFDHAHLRNPLTYELARWIGIPAPRARLMELYVNETRDPLGPEHYVGLYVLTENIKRGKNRVEVAKLDPTHRGSPGVTGGYILKIDRLGPGESGFTGGRQPLQFVYPKERRITDPQRRWIKDHLDTFGEALFGPQAADPTDGYARYIDVDSWIDYHFLNEYVLNPDAYTLSTYFYKERGGKLRMGPVWDYDRAMRTNEDPTWVGRPADPTGWTTDAYHLWWGELFKDPAFRERYRARGRAFLENELRIERVLGLVDTLAAQMAEAEARDHERWPITLPGTWENDVIALKAWLAQRDRWFRAELLEAPRFYSNGGFRPPFTLEIRHRNEEGTLYYTLDGADPRLNNGQLSPRAMVYTKPVAIERDTRVRARVQVGDLWSRVTQQGFTTKDLTLAVSEIMYNPPGGRNHEFVELLNYGTEPVSLEGVRLQGDISFSFSIGAVKVLGPGEYVLVVRDRRQFATAYDTTHPQIAGQYLGRLSNTDGKIEVFGPVGQRVAKVRYKDAWFPETDRAGHSLVLRDLAKAAQWVHKNGWRASAARGGSPGEAEPAKN